MIERIGGEAIFTYRAGDGAPVRGTVALRDHRAAVVHLVGWLTAATSPTGIGSVGETSSASALKRWTAV